MQPDQTYERSRAPVSEGSESKVGTAAQTAKDTAKDEARSVVHTAKQEAGTVVDEAKGQAKRIGVKAREQLDTRARSGNDRLVEMVRNLADELRDMARDGDSPTRTVMSDVADRGHRVADYLSDRGPDGLLREVQDFARRRPGTFLAVAAAAGFVVGRLGKGVWASQREESTTTTGLRDYERYDNRYDDSAVGVAAAPPAAFATEPVVADVQPAAPVETTPGRATGAPQWSEPPVPAAGGVIPPAGMMPAGTGMPGDVPPAVDYPEEPKPSDPYRGGDVR